MAQCSRHPQYLAQAACLRCGTPTCAQCATDYGAFCSDACRTGESEPLSESTIFLSREAKSADANPSPPGQTGRGPVLVPRSERGIHSGTPSPPSAPSVVDGVNLLNDTVDFAVKRTASPTPELKLPPTVHAQSPTYSSELPPVIRPDEVELTATPPSLPPTPADAIVPPPSGRLSQEAAAADAQEALIKKIVMMALLTIVCGAIVVVGAIAWKMWLHPYAKVRWQIPLVAGQSHTIIVDDDQRFILQVGNVIYSIDISEAKELWSYTGADNQWTTIHHLGDGGMLLLGDKHFLRLSHDGREIWKIPVAGDRRVVAYSDDVVLMVLGRMLEHKEWKAHRLAEMTKEQRDKALRFNYLSDEGFVGVWENVAVVAHSMTEDRELWRQSMHARLNVGNFTFDNGLVVTSTSRTTDGNVDTTVIAFDPQTGTAQWKADLKQPLISGPLFVEDNVVFSDPKSRYTVSREGELLSTGVGGMVFVGNADFGDEYSDDEGGVTDGVGADGVYLRERRLIAVTNGKERWRYEMAGGILSYGVGDEQVVITGHTTAKGGMSENIDATNSLLGVEDELAGFVAQGAAVADFAVIGLDRKTGEKLWEIEDLTGTVLCDGNRALVLQDTRRTSVIVRNSGATGQLFIHQLKPSTGKKFYTRKNSVLRLDHPRLEGDTLVGVAYNREGGKTANCLGIYGLRVK